MVSEGKLDYIWIEKQILVRINQLIKGHDMGELVTTTEYSKAVDVFNTKKVMRIFRETVECNSDNVIIQFDDNTKIQVPVEPEIFSDLFLNIEGREYISLK